MKVRERERERERERKVKKSVVYMYHVWSLAVFDDESSNDVKPLVRTLVLVDDLDILLRPRVHVAHCSHTTSIWWKRWDINM